MRLHRPLPALTRAHWGKRLLIWPETAVPDFLHRVLEPLLETLAQEAGRHGSSLLVGIPFMNLETRQYYNAAFVVGSEEVYFKRHLVPFGEFLALQAPAGAPIVVHGDPHVRFQRRGAGGPALGAGGGPLGGGVDLLRGCLRGRCGRPCRKRTCS